MYNYKNLTIAIIVVLCITAVIDKKIHGCVNKTVDKKGLNDNKLHDIIHDYHSDDSIKQYYLVGDIMTILLCIFFLWICITNKSYVTIFHFAIIFVLSYGIKSIFTISTILPDPSGTCKEKHKNIPFAKNLIGDCNKLMFSGHAVSLFIILFILYNIKCDGNKEFVISSRCMTMLILYVLVTCYVIIATRNHYTIDVLVSFFVAYTLCSVYYKTMVHSRPNFLNSIYKS